MTHPHFRIDTLHERSRELANQIDRTMLLGDESQLGAPPRPRRALGVFSHRFARARTTTR